MESNNDSLISINLLKKGNSLLGQHGSKWKLQRVLLSDFPVTWKYTIQMENRQIRQHAL